MNKIETVFQNGKVLIPFITAGDPNLSTTKKIIISMEENGADIIEIGIPFSDPVAEGPVIEQASLRALESGTTTDKIFDLIKTLRREGHQIPILFMTYANVVFGYGTERFLQGCNECEVEGVILPDVPYEEKEELLTYFQNYHVTLISMIAPTSNERIQMIAKEAEGFIYCVSSLGVTGIRSEITTDLVTMINQVKASKDIPCAIGFGISTAEQARNMAKISDGVIIGSAIVRLIAEHGKDAPAIVGKYVYEMKKAVSSSRKTHEMGA